MSVHEELLSQVETYVAESTRFEQKGIKASAARARKALADLREAIERDRQNADFLRFQHDELAGARLVDGEQEELERKSDTMSHAEEIKGALYEADARLSAEGSGAVGNLRAACGQLEAIARVLPEADALASRLDSAYIELKDISEEISRLLEGIDFDPAELDAVNSRLDTIYNLEKKYHCQTVADLQARQAELKVQLEGIDNSDEALGELQARLDESERKCNDCAAVLTSLRADAARRIEGEMQERLVPLGMPNVRFAIAMERDQSSRNGCDRVAFLFSANNIPRMKDKTGAVQRRLVIVPFDAKFTPADPDFRPNIKDELCEQEPMEYLILLGLKALRRVLMNAQFTTSTRVQGQLDEYEQNNNPIIGFIKEVGLEGIENEPTKTVYRKYKEYCISNNFQALSNIEFSRQITKRCGFIIVDKWISRLGKCRVFVSGKDGDS